MGRRYREAGLAEGEAALRDLARHPATAQHIATKLARHFVADDPPDPAVARLAQVFRETDGDLALVARALILLSEPWEAPLAKLKSPQDLVISTLRATGFEGETEKLVIALRLLGQAPWAAPSPAGWPDRAEDWASPDALLKRIEFVADVAQRVGDRIDPYAGDMLSRTTNGRIPATTHRVVARGQAARRHRYALPFFAHPRPECDLSVIPAFVAPGEAPQHAPIDAGTFLDERLREIGLIP